MFTDSSATAACEPIRSRCPYCGRSCDADDSYSSMPAHIVYRVRDEYEEKSLDDLWLIRELCREHRKELNYMGMDSFYERFSLPESRHTIKRFKFPVLLKMEKYVGKRRDLQSNPGKDGTP